MMRCVPFCLRCLVPMESFEKTLRIAISHPQDRTYVYFLANNHSLLFIHIQMSRNIWWGLQLKLINEISNFYRTWKHRISIKHDAAFVNTKNAYLGIIIPPFRIITRQKALQNNCLPILSLLSWFSSKSKKTYIILLKK